MTIRDLNHHLAMSAIAALTMWVALVAWGPFLAVPGDYLGPVALIAAALALSGAFLRALGTPTPLILLVQSGVLVSTLCRALAGSYLPDRKTLDAVGAALATARDAAQDYAAPIGPEAPPVAPLLILGGAALVLTMDLLACSLRRVPLSGLALLAAYAVPVGIPTEGSTWFSFLLAATGFLALLHLDARHRMQRWGRAVGPNDRDEWTDLNPLGEALRVGAGRIGAVAIGAAVAAPLVIPVMDLGLFGAGGGGAGDIRIDKPITDMRRDLQRPDDRPLITVRTDDPQPAYLRVAALHRYTGAEWSSGDRDVRSSNQADGALPAPAGVGPDVARRTYDYDVTIAEEFDSTWLPTQFPAASVTAEQDWRFDPDSMDFLASEGQTTAGIDYTMTAIEHDFDSDDHFRDATPGDVDEEFLALPDTVPTSVGSLADEVTRGATSDYERAVRLQRWFRSEFTYSLERAPVGTGNNTLSGFLAPEGRVGYCEQFASAMGVMARHLGIPTRVAVGFLRPERNADGSWTYSSHDLHAWPELYFSGAGWVRFEPTPAGRAANVPTYTSLSDDRTEADPATGPDQDAAGDQASAGPTAAPRDPSPTGAAADPIEEQDGWFSWPLLATIGGVVLLLAAATPQWWRRRQRRHRLGNNADTAWDELWATAHDFGVNWPGDRSPREIAAVLALRLRTLEETDALQRLVGAVEEERYGRGWRGGDRAAYAASLTDDTERCSRGLAQSVTRGARLRGRWLPRSVFTRPPRGGALHDREPVPLGR